MNLSALCYSGKNRFSFTVVVLAACWLFLAATPGWGQGSEVVVVPALQHAMSPPTHQLLPIPPAPEAFTALPVGPMHGPRAPRPAQPDPVLQGSTSTTPLDTTAGENFIGIGRGLPGFTVQYIPPDTNGAAGPTQFVQWVNASFAAFDKATGGVVYGPVAGNTLWQALGGPCARNNSGDPIAQYDKQAGVWVMMQPVFKSPYYLCLAVSTGSDFNTSSWRLYAFPVPNKLFPDYPKLGVWPDGYYITYNQFQGQFFVGPAACAIDRASILAGSSNVAMQCATSIGASFGSLLPGDWDGATPPPAGSPEYLVNFGANNASLDLWNFHVDWSTPANSSLVRTNIPVAAFTEACGGGACVPQAGTSQLLDSLGDRVMYRLAYRNLGDHEALLVNHSVNTGTAANNTGIRWYELRKAGSAISLYQQGTFAPDSSYRWMGSMAMDSSGNIALGYSVSSSSISPTIKYTGREATSTDDPGLMAGENDLLGNLARGSQTSYNRWGDYSSMALDPTDDCTFWFTTEYQSSNGNAWSTRIASFSFPSCSPAIPTPSFSLAATPASQTVSQGSPAGYSVSVAPAGGFTGDVNLSVTAGLPTGATASFDTTCGLTLNCVTVSGTSAVSSNLTVTTSGVTPGTYNLTVTGSNGSLNSSTNVTLVVSAPVSGSFTVTAAPASQTVSPGTTTFYTVTVTPADGFTGSVSLSVSGLPPRSNANFTPNPVSLAGGAAASSTLKVKTNIPTPVGTYTLTITGTSGSLSSAAQVDLIVQ